MIFKNRFKLFLLLAIINPFIFNGNGQVEQLRSLEINPSLISTVHKLQSRDRRNLDTFDLSVPFFDDFTYDGPYPVDSLWADRYVFVNKSFAVLPPSSGVATFDGLNEYGMPYDPGAVNSFGQIADKLTSVFIDLSSYSDKDSIYLSFFYQPQGLGDEPESYDSLVLEIKPIRLWKGTYWDSNAWYRLWSVPGKKLDEFKQVIIHIPEMLVNQNQDTIAYFYHSTFQFRFANYANRAGNVDHWNLDYVLLATKRKYNNLYHKDLAVVYPPPSLVQNYYSVPWKHLIQDKSKLRQQLDITVRNLYNQPLKARGGYEILDTFDQQRIMFNDNANSQDIYDILTFPVTTKVQNEFKFQEVSAADNFSLYYQVVNFNFLGDQHWDNNYGHTWQEFSNFYAYDDGIPEKGYGIINATHSIVALEFELLNNYPVDDSLRGVMIYFNQSNETRARMTFSIHVWSNYQEQPIYTMDTLTPDVDNRKPNGFYYFPFDSAIAVPQHFYIGWEQYSDFFMNVGLDMNYFRILGDSAPVTPNSHLHYYTSSGWKSSSVKGAPMIRPVFSSKPIVQKIKTNKLQSSIQVYPNPVRNTLYLRTSGTKSITEVQLIDMTGHLMPVQITQNLSLDLSHLPVGVYILRVFDGQQIFSKKIFKY